MLTNTVQRLLLWVTLGILLTTNGFTVDSWQCWSFIAVFWALQWTAIFQGRTEAVIAIFDAVKKCGYDPNKVLEKMQVFEENES